MQPEIVIADTSRLSTAELAEAVNAAFAGYFVPIQHSASTFAAACRWFSLDTAASVYLHTPDGKRAGLALLGIRGNRGWCGPFGIVAEFRGQGLARTLAQALIARGTSLGLKSLTLEVMVQNERAIRTYSKAGFTMIRDVSILEGEFKPDFQTQDNPPSCELRNVPLEDALCFSAQIGQAPSPTWQRQKASLLNLDMRALAAWSEGAPKAVLVFRQNEAAKQVVIGGLVWQDESIALSLLRHVAPIAPRMFCLNEPDNSALCALLRNVGLQEIHRQHEMRLALV